MAASLWDKLWSSLLIGVVSSIVVAGLGFLCVQLWKCLTRQQITTQTAVEERDHAQPRPVGNAYSNAVPDLNMGTVNGGDVGESAHPQPLPESDAATHANVEPDLEMGNGSGPAEGGEPIVERELELGIVNGGEGIDYFSDQEAHLPVIKFAVTTPKTQVTRDATTGALVRPVVEMDVPHSQQEEAAE